MNEMSSTPTPAWATSNTETGQPMAGSIVLPPRPPEPARRASRSGSSSMLRWIGLGVAALVVAGAAFSMLGGQQGGALGSASADRVDGRNGNDDTYSYYHNMYLDGDSYESRWGPDETPRSGYGEEYDGPYTYGRDGYGSAGITARTTGAAAGRDPLYSDMPAIPDVFEEYGAGRTDPLHGAPATAPGPDAANPWFDPWAGSYQNPYENRMRLSYASASADPYTTPDTGFPRR